MNGFWNIFKPKSNGVQKIVNLVYQQLNINYQAISIATTNLSDVKNRTGWPIKIDAIVVPPFDYNERIIITELSIKHIIMDSIQETLLIRWLLRTCSHTNSEEQYTISDIYRKTRINRILSIYLLHLILQHSTNMTISMKEKKEVILWKWTMKWSLRGSIINHDSLPENDWRIFKAEFLVI